MNSIKMNGMAQRPSVSPAIGFSKYAMANILPSAISPLASSLLSSPLFISLLFCGSLFSSLSHAADADAVPSEQVRAATAILTPLHEHSSVEPKAPAPSAQPEKPAPTTVPKEAETTEMPEPDNKIVIVSRPQVTGLWAMTIPGAQCIEYYNFMEKGDVVIKSGAEWTYGNYVYQVPAASEPGTPILAMRIQYDNLQTDCSGNAIDQRGEDQQQYVKWTGPSSMEFCGTQDGSQCFASLNRVLP